MSPYSLALMSVFGDPEVTVSARVLASGGLAILYSPWFSAC